MTQQSGLGTRAVVVGAGMGGLMAAEIASRFFDEVVVLERDPSPIGAEPRRGVPQGAHVHALLIGGRRNLERLFPGFTSQLIDAGAQVCAFGSRFRLRDHAGWQPLRDTGWQAVFATRPLIEATVRTRVLDDPRVALRFGAVVEGWAVTGDRVAGVRLRGEEGAETLDADLVIDTSGRSGGSLDWLEEAGFGRPPETRLEIGTSYASALFRKPEGWNGPTDCYSIFGADPDTRAGVMFSVENQCWIGSLMGRFDQAPPGDPDGFMRFAESLCEPVIHDWMRQGERISPIRVYRAPVSRWRHYETMRAFPDRLLPLGDSVAHVNPMLGQGISIASFQATELLGALERRAAEGGGLDGLAADYLPAVQAFIGGVWQTLETFEFRYASTRGDRPPDIEERIARSNALRAAIVDDAELHRLFTGIGHFALPPDVLATPEMQARIARANV